MTGGLLGYILMLTVAMGLLFYLVIK